MSYAKFNRGIMLRTLLSKERVTIYPYDELGNAYSQANPDIQLFIGAFCHVRIAFASVPGFPEMAHASVGSRSFEYIAGTDDENDIAEEIYEHAKQMIWFCIESKNTQITKRIERQRGRVLPIPQSWGGANTEGLTTPTTEEEKFGASNIFFDKVEYLGYKSDSPGGRYAAKTAWYKDISWETPESKIKQSIRNGYIAFLDNIEELFPGIRVLGTRDEEIAFEYASLDGGFEIYDNTPEYWEASMVMDIPTFGYCGGIHLDIKIPGTENLSDCITKKLKAKASKIRASVGSLTESPLSILRIHTECNYQEEGMPTAKRTLYSAATPVEIKAALRDALLEPIALAHRILTDDLDGYEQYYYDEQYDVSQKFYGFDYDATSNQLRFSYDIDECVNIDRLPTCHDSEDYVIDNLTLERLEQLMCLEDDSFETDPYFVEWSLKHTVNEDGTITFEVGEFPELSFVSDNYSDGYDKIYELIHAELDRRKNAGEEIPQSMTWQEREAYYGHAN